MARRPPPTTLGLYYGRNASHAAPEPVQNICPFLLFLQVLPMVPAAANPQAPLLSLLSLLLRWPPLPQSLLLLRYFFNVCRFVGGETAALERLSHYLWAEDRLRTYFHTRNGMVPKGEGGVKGKGCISPAMAALILWKGGVGACRMEASA